MLLNLTSRLITTEWFCNVTAVFSLWKSEHIISRNAPIPDILIFGYILFIWTLTPHLVKTNNEQYGKLAIVSILSIWLKNTEIFYKLGVVKHSHGPSNEPVSFSLIICWRRGHKVWKPSVMKAGEWPRTNYQTRRRSLSPQTRNFLRSLL